MDSSNQPLLSSASNGDNRPIAASYFSGGESDISPVGGISDFLREFRVESKKLWSLAGPAIFMGLCSYSLGAVTQVFAGQVGTIQLAAVAIENSIIAGFALGVLLGMGSALETLCGQAFGAGQIEMLGVYMQRSWIILVCTSFLLTFAYIFATPLLKLLGQTTEISEAAGELALWMIPQLYAYAFNFPIAKFLQSQSKIMVMAMIAAVALVFHTIFSWLLMLKLGLGLVGAALVLNASWVFIVVAQLAYIFSGTCGRAWSGFSSRAFQNLWGFVKLSLASSVMLCLEVWYYTALILFAGHLKDAKVSVDALSICINIVGWTIMIALGWNVAISVRVSNELGAGHPRKAKFAVVVVVMTSFVIGLILSLILIITRKSYPSLFSNSEDVQKLVYKLTPLLALCMVINNVQPVLSGVAIGAGWQAVVARVNVACYYMLGVPLGLILGYKLNLGVTGIWYGMLTGTIVQTCVLFLITYRTNWKKEASIAGQRIRQWGGEPDPQNSI